MFKTILGVLSAIWSAPSSQSNGGGNVRCSGPGVGDYGTYTEDEPDTSEDTSCGSASGWGESRY